MFWTAIGIGLGIGIVHAALLFVVMVLTRQAAKTQANETIELMRERNLLDAEKIVALNRIAECIEVAD